MGINADFKRGGGVSTLIEKLEELEQAYRSSYEELKDRDELIIADTFVKAINIVKQHSDWISINERLPSVNLKVLAFHERKKKVFIATYDRDLEMWLEGGLPYSSNFLYWITHWQPLPQPPIEVKP